MRVGIRGVQKKKGATVKLYALFNEKMAEVVEERMVLYDEEENVKYYCMDFGVWVSTILCDS